MLSSMPTSLIVLEYLKVFLSGPVLLTVALILIVFLFRNQIRAFLTPGISLSSEYSRLLDKTTALSEETAKRAEQGELTPEEMKRALTSQAETWRNFQDGRDGRSS